MPDFKTPITVNGVAIGAGQNTIAVACRAYRSSNISCANASFTLLLCNQERYDTDGFHSTSSNTEQFVAPYTGYYAMSAHVQWAANGTGYRMLQLVYNGTAIIASDQRAAISSVALDQSIACNGYFLNAGDYVYGQMYHTAGTSINVLTTTAYSPEFAIHFIGK